MKWKIKLQKDYLLVVFIVLIAVLLYLQYLYSKQNLIEKYKSEEYAKTIQIRDRFKTFLNNVELLFKSKLEENLKVLDSVYLMYDNIKDFDADEIAQIINQEYKEKGYYEVFVIDKTYKVIKSSYKPDLGLDLGKFTKYRKIFENIFSGKQKIDISYLIFDYSSLSLKRYFLILSPDKKYLLQIAYVVDIYPYLKKIYYKLLNRYRDLENIKLYFMDKYFIYPVNLQNKFKYKKSIEKRMDETSEVLIKILKDIGKYREYKNIIERHKKCKIFDKLTSIVIKLFSSNKNVLSKLDFKKHRYVTYTLTSGFFSNLSNRLIVKNEFSTYFLEKDIESIKTRFLIIGLFFILLGIFIKFLTYYISSKIKDMVYHMQNNIPIKKNYFFIKEVDDLVATYNSYRQRLNEEIEKNKKLLLNNKRFIIDTVHQLKTPLSIITLNSDFLKMQLKDKNMEDTLNEIDAAIAMFTNSYEDLSYLASQDTVEYKPVKLDVSEILKKRVDFFMPLAKARNKILIYEIDDNIYFNINKVELERLIDNNVSNAIDYSKGKEIKIILKKLKDGFVLRFESFGEKILNPDKIFEKNYREQDHKRGLGIGLNIVKKICEKYNISYKVISKEGQNIFEYVFKY